jgi:hypothetical protein
MALKVHRVVELFTEKHIKNYEPRKEYQDWFWMLYHKVRYVTRLGRSALYIFPMTDFSDFHFRSVIYNLGDKPF